jgi:hypothetical protein
MAFLVGIVAIAGAGLGIELGGDNGMTAARRDSLFFLACCDVLFFDS